MRRPSRHKQQLARLEADAVAGHGGEVARSEDRIQAVMEHGVKRPRSLNRNIENKVKELHYSLYTSDG